MTAFITLPQAPVVNGESGHLTDHNNIKAGLLALWTAVQQSMYNVCSPTYGADPTGAADSSTAIQNAIVAASASGGVVVLPAGTYKCAPGVLTMNNGTTGFSGVSIVGAGRGATTIKKSANGVLLTMSGPSSDPTAGATHCHKCTLQNLTLDGGNFTGLLMQTYYTDKLYVRDVDFQNNNDAGVQTVEFWDSRFITCVFDSLGSTTANTTAPAVWLCNTVAGSGYGSSTDTTNQIQFWGCRFENNKSGALRVERGVGGGTGQPYGINLTDCKIESTAINGGPMVFVDTTTFDVNLKHVYFYAGGFYSGYSTAQDVIVFGPQWGTLDDVLIRNASATACIADGVTVNSPFASGVVVLRNVRGSYTGGATPTGAHINIGTMTGFVELDNVTADNGTLWAGNPPNIYGQAAVTSTTTIANTAALSTLHSYTVPAGEPKNGSRYRMRGYCTYSVTGTPTMAFTVYWGGTGGTAIASIPTITAASGISFASLEYDIDITFSSATSLTAVLRLTIVTNTSTGATSRFVGVPGSATTVSSSTAKALALGFQWGTASASNTISLLGGGTDRVQ